MSRLTVGQKLPDFTFETPFEKGRTLADTVGRVSGKSAVIFLRYYGCILCQYDMRQFAQAYDRIAADGGQILVVLQSDPAHLAAEISRETFPYDIICDPEQKLYRELEILPAASEHAFLAGRTLEKIAAATAAGVQHGTYEGEELQLPAVFVAGPDRTLTYVHYGTSGGDIPDVDTLTVLLSRVPGEINQGKEPNL